MAAKKKPARRRVKRSTKSCDKRMIKLLRELMGRYQDCLWVRRRGGTPLNGPRRK